MSRNSFSNDDFSTKAEFALLKDNFEPHNLSKRICEAIDNQKDVDRAIQNIINTTLAKDIDTRKIVKELVIECMKDNSWKTWAKFFTVLLSLVLAFISGEYLNK